MRERVYRVEAIVLKRTDHGEADRLLTLFTPEFGKVRAMAKGARKPSSRKRGHIELFTHSVLMLAKGRYHDVVTQADTVDAFISLRENLDRVGYAYYLTELLDRFTQETDPESRRDSRFHSKGGTARDDGGEENRALYALLLDALNWVGDLSNNPDLLARFFELRLLQYVGYRPELFRCVNCGKALEPVENYFSPEAGGVLDLDCIETQRGKIPGHGRDAEVISLEALKVLRYLQSREWETVRKLRLSAEVLANVEALLQNYTAHHLEKHLKSVEFLHDLKAKALVDKRPG